MRLSLRRERLRGWERERRRCCGHAMGAPVLVRFRALLNHYFHSGAHPCAGSTCICACWAVWTCQCCHEESQLVGAELPVVSVCLGWSISGGFGVPVDPIDGDFTRLFGSCPASEARLRVGLDGSPTRVLARPGPRRASPSFGRAREGRLRKRFHIFRKIAVAQDGLDGLSSGRARARPGRARRGSG